MRVEGFTDRVYNTVFPDPAKFMPPAGVFLIAELDGAAGRLRRHPDAVARPRRS